MTTSRRQRALEACESGLTRAAFLDGKPVGVLVAFPISLTLPGPVLSPSVGLADAAVLPTYRRRGVMKALMRTVLAEAADEGRSFATLFASEGTIYEYYGFGPGIFAAYYSLLRSASALWQGPASSVPGGVRLLGWEEAQRLLPPVFDAARLQRAGEVERLPAWWSGLLEAGAGVPRFCACYERDGRVSGYAIYEVVTPATGLARVNYEPELTDRALRVIELVSVDADAYRGLWGHLVSLDLVGAVVTGRRPLDEPLRFLLRDTRALSTLRVRDHSWLRLVDVPKALAARHYNGPGRIALAVNDQFCPWNEGCYLIEVDGQGCADVSPRSATPEIVCGVAALATAFLGATSWCTLGTGGRATQVTAGALERADRLFSTSQLPFCTAQF
jgi:predicted acetyltransferase